MENLDNIVESFLNTMKDIIARLEKKALAVNEDKKQTDKIIEDMEIYNLFMETAKTSDENKLCYLTKMQNLFKKNELEQVKKYFLFEMTSKRFPQAFSKHFHGFNLLSKKVKNKSDLRTFFIEMGNQMLGCMTFEFKAHKEIEYIYLHFILVSEKCRGLGLGSLLMDKLKLMDMPIICWVSDVKEALYFYRKKKFTQDDGFVKTVLDIEHTNSALFHTYYIEKLLNRKDILKKDERLYALYNNDIFIHSMPPIEEVLFKFHDTLPIYQHLNDIFQIITSHAVTLISLGTGTGKTTQIPLLLSRSPFHIVIIVEPKQVACKWICETVSMFIGKIPGEEVGYSYKDNHFFGDKTIILFVTDGTFIHMLDKQNCQILKRCNYVIIDEAHEIKIDTEIILYKLKKKLLSKDKDTKIRLIIMSATLNKEILVNYFGNSNISVGEFNKDIHKKYKMEVTHFTENEMFNQRDTSCKNFVFVSKKCIEIHRDDKSYAPILIFMPGTEEIKYWVNVLNTDFKKLFEDKNDYIIIPLYSTLSHEEQNLVNIEYDGKRKIIVSTDLAEASITINNLTYVIDSGFKKFSRYNTELRSESLESENISQSSANQRMGRASRTNDGFCFRMYSEKCFNKMKPYDTSEILTQNLDKLILRLACEKDTNYRDFMTAPEENDVYITKENMKDIEALDSEGNLTALGSLIQKFPIDIKYACAIEMSFRFGCEDDVLKIAAMLTCKHNELFINCSQMNKEHKSSEGELIGLLNVFNLYCEKKNGLCVPGDNYKLINVNEKTMAKVFKTHEKIKQIGFSLPKRYLINNKLNNNENIKLSFLTSMPKQLAAIQNKDLANIFTFDTYNKPKNCLNSNIKINSTYMYLNIFNGTLQHLTPINDKVISCSSRSIDSDKDLEIKLSMGSNDLRYHQTKLKDYGCVITRGNSNIAKDYDIYKL
jgi:pre-mRNA-splicing factor ATP-dependent RNA helicase DHX15/PRP43